MPKSDPQQRLVYAMERHELRGMAWHRAPLKYLRRKARAVCKRLYLPPVTLSVRRLNCGGYYLADAGQIFLDVEYQNANSLAHELAHHYVFHRHPKAQDHGPEFTKAYGQMLRLMRLMTPRAFKAICQEYGVKHA